MTAKKLTPTQARKGLCSLDGCDKPARTWGGICLMHYFRYRRNGTYECALPPGMDPLARLLAQTERQANGCLLFTGQPSTSGYPRVGHGLDEVYGHRLVYERMVGPIPPGHTHVHHTCHTPLCLEATHLKALTPTEHKMAHGYGVGPCRRCGSADWMVRPTGKRECRECRRRRDSRRAS